MINETVAAISTPMGTGGIGIVRISGEKALCIASKIFVPCGKNTDVMRFKSHTVHYGIIKDLSGKTVDEALLTYMKAPHSYTGEDVVELSCHGSITSVKYLLRAVIEAGARLAGRGEFTKRAFLNGRLDLAQAEAVTDIITSKSESALACAVNQLEGRLSEKINAVREKLVEVMAYIEAETDFPEDDVSGLSADEVKGKLKASLAEIKALLNGMNSDDVAEAATSSAASGEIDESLLSDIERDAIGEVANISMGTSATTLYSLVNMKVNITTPQVSLANWDMVVQDYPRPCVFIQIKYTEGLDGSNILVLQERDVKIITDLMMGGDGTNTDGELGELHLSAISEAMNQMMGSSATSLSSMLGKKIDISPPVANLVDMNDLKDSGFATDFMEGTFVKISFRMQIGELVDSTLIQLYPLDFAKSLYDFFMSNQMGGSSEPTPAPAPTPAPEPVAASPTPTPAPAPGPAPMPTPGPMPMAYDYSQMPQMAPMQPTNVAPAQFQAFTPDIAALIGQENINLIKDVPLEVTVELGRTSKTIHEILDFAPGTIIELEKIAGEPIDVLVNGKFVAKGEVVVIEENFGIRVTEIIKD